jgi:queuine tRNA-ribosyltransferase
VKLGFDIEATCGDARAATVRLPRGTFQTPVFMPVGTRGAVRALTVGDVESVGSEIILGNTYHLMLRPTAELIAEMGGLHRFENWNGCLLTDSGGFQVFSLSPKVDEGGVLFKSVYDGSLVRFTPERAVEVQEMLGADIAMLLDVCTSLPATAQTLRDALDRTIRWAERQRAIHKRADQVQFGIVQGGTDHEMRIESAERTVEIGFDGYAIGGLSVGETRPEMMASIEAANSALPKDRPRYLMGVGDPISLIEGVARGIDMFDCVLPTRLARHGTALTSTGRLAVKNALFARSDEPLDASCSCTTCQRHSRGYIRHLVSVGEQTASTLVTIHNLTYLHGLMQRARASIIDGTFPVLRDEVNAVWLEGPGQGPGRTKQRASDVSNAAEASDS